MAAEFLADAASRHAAALGASVDATVAERHQLTEVGALDAFCGEDGDFGPGSFVIGLGKQDGADALALGAGEVAEA